jgi:hypothetical protein
MKILSMVLVTLGAVTTPDNPGLIFERLRNMTDADRTAISRCSQAALLMVWATEKFPDSPNMRREYFGKLINSDDIKDSFKSNMPSKADGLAVLVTADRYLSVKPPKSPYEFHVLQLKYPARVR